MLSEFVVIKNNVTHFPTKNLVDDSVDNAIIEETNMLLENLQQDMLALSEIHLIINENIVLDGEKLDKIEENVIEVDKTIEETLPLLEEVIELKDNYTFAKIAGGVVVGGTLCGGVGVIFGVVPGIIGLGLGGGGGGVIAYVVNLFS